MKYYQFVIIPDEKKPASHMKIPKFLLVGGAALMILFAVVSGFVAVDYVSLVQMREHFVKISAENQGLKGEAKLLVANLTEVRQSLSRVQDFSKKLSEITNIQMSKFSQKTGIGPLSPQDMKRIDSMNQPRESGFVPLGVNFDQLVFRTAFDHMESLKEQADLNAIKLQQLLSSLSQKKSLLSSIPSIAPVDGWVTSGFGERISPFTGKKDYHSGVDVASPVGTPIYAPADGVVIFSGAKAGFGNFIMIAHGNGVISRYGHNAQNMVHPGQKIKRGEQIATVGMTGRTTGPHLHYEIVINGRTVNPKRFMLNL